MPQAKAASRSNRGAAARSEVNGKVKNVSFRGLALTIPAVPPGELLWDLDNDDVMGILRTVLGPEQFNALRQKVATSKMPMQKAADELKALATQEIFKKHYGISLGE